MADFIVSLGNSTELEAVNEMLATIGVAPVASLDATISRDAVLAKTALKTVAREVLLERWRFNSEFGVQVLPAQKINWIDNIDNTATELFVYEPPVRGQSATKQRSLLRWKLSSFVNTIGAGLFNQSSQAIALQSPTSNALVDGVSITITSSSIANPTNINATAHGLINGQSVVIAGHSGSTPSIDGEHIVTVVDADNFTIPVNVTTGGTGGTVSNKTPQLIFYDARLGRDGFAVTERDALYIDVTWSVDFTDMPQTARDYITKRAARRFAQQQIGATDLVGYSANDEAISRRTLNRDQKPERKYNILNNPNTRRIHGGRYVPHSQIDSAHPRGGTA